MTMIGINIAVSVSNNSKYDSTSDSSNTAAPIRSDLHSVFSDRQIAELSGTITCIESANQHFTNHQTHVGMHTSYMPSGYRKTCQHCLGKLIARITPTHTHTAEQSSVSHIVQNFLRPVDTLWW